MSNPIRRITEKLRHYYTALGWSGVMAFCLSKVRGRKPLYQTRRPGMAHPIFVRLGTTDASVLRQVLIEQHYDFALDPPPATIIDAGANIGLSAVYFANRYPDAKIIAIEPETSNYEILLKNTGPYANIMPIKAALWHQSGQIQLFDPGAGNHGFQTKGIDDQVQMRGELTKAVTIPELLEREKWSELDLLKIDVEGAEKEVFDESSEWISRVRAVMIELHDETRPGCLASFQRATVGFTQPCHRGESLLVTRNGAHQNG
jgi:FkbM family methyltransferase